MRELELSRKQFNKLEKFPLIEGTLESESNLYWVPNSKSEIIKVYKDYEDIAYMDEKWGAINNLIKYTSELDFPELLVPSGILKVKKQFMGSIYPVLEGYTIKQYLYTFYCPVKVKIEIFRKVGGILEKIKNSNPKYNAAFADVHTDNFMIIGYPSKNILNGHDFKVMACDTDSMKILDSPGVTGLYLADSDKFADYEKYPLDKDYMVIPSSNTDIYCFIMMILELVAKSNCVSFLNEDEYYYYLDYLDSLGFDSNLLRSFASIYEDDKDNISPLPYIDGLIKMSKKSTLVNFYKKRTLKK